MNPIHILPFIGVVLIVCVWKLLKPRIRKPSEDDYLNVLSFIEWKAGRTIHAELESRLDGTIPVRWFYRDLHRMEEEGWVEHREGIDEHGAFRMFRRVSNDKEVGPVVPYDPREEPVLA